MKMFARLLRLTLYVFLFVSAFRSASADGYVVDRTDDANVGTCTPAANDCTLRGAINAANNSPGGDTITFNIPGSGPFVINLTGPLPEITTDLNIQGPGANVLTVRRDTGGDYRIFTIKTQNLTIGISGLTLRDGKVTSDFGGAIDSVSMLTLKDCVFANNQTSMRPSAGGAVHLILGSGYFTGCTFTGNMSPGGGAIAYEGYDPATALTVENCTFSGNTAVADNGTSSGGAAIAATGGGPQGVNPPFVATLQVNNCTFANNTSQAGGGAIELGAYDSNTTARAFLNNTILANNSPKNFGLLALNGGTTTLTSQGYNLSSDDGSGFLTATGDQINTDAMLGPLQDNGGPTPTHALMVSSPAVNTGNTSLLVDQRGVARPQVGADDKGAFELVFTPNEMLVVTTLTDEDNGTSDPRFGTGTSLREAINRANSDGIDSAITFDPTLFGGSRKTIVLNGTELPMLISNGKFSITAPPAGVTLSGNNQSRIFQVDSGANVTVTGVTMRNGVGFNGGYGGAIFNRGALLLDGCTFNANGAPQGGAIASQANLSGASLTMRNCTLSGNSANSYGGALSNLAGTATLDSCTIAGNTAPSGGGSGIASTGTSATSTILRNSIVAANSDTDVDYIGSSNSFQSTGYNLIGDGNGISGFAQSGDQIIGNGDPGLALLAENGGRTQTRALQGGSLAVNTGNTSLTSDQRGVARPQGAADDKGAFEYNSFAESLVVTTTVDEDNGTSDPAFGTGTSLREAINRANSDGVDTAITFSPTVFAAPRKSITLNGTALPNLGANGKLSITAAAAGVEINANNQSRVFAIDNGADVALTGLTIRNGTGAAFVGINAGGGISNAGTLSLDGCTLSGNNANFGGAIYSTGTLSLNATTVTGNSAQTGGAIYSSSSLSGVTLTVRNSTLTGNTAQSAGGALFDNSSVSVIESSTIVSNTAPAGAGSGLASAGNTTTRTEVHNSIIAGNTNTDVDLVSGTNSSVQSNGYNLIGDGNASSVFVQPGDQVIGNGDPGLAALADNGGPTQTRATSKTSPAFNTGDTDLSVDQRGVARPQGGIADKGAYELNSFPESLVVTTAIDENNGTSDPSLGTGTSLREAIQYANSSSDLSTITFALPETQKVNGAWIIQLNGELPRVTQSTTITGPGAKFLTVRRSAGGDYRIFTFLPRSSSAFSISNMTIRDGKVTDASGGAILCFGALTLRSCLITDNQALGSATGGGVDLFSGDGLFVECTFSNNTAGQQGGGINYEGDGNHTLTLQNCTVASNIAAGVGWGGGIYNVSTSGGSTLQVSNCTVANNAGADTGGIRTDGIFSGSTARTFLSNTIVANSAPNLKATVQSGGTATVTSQGYNLSSDNGSGFLNAAADQINTNPALDPNGLQDNGGPTPTIALQSNSPALDKGKDASNTGKDQRGQPRPYDFGAIPNAAGGDGSDIGAYEFNDLQTGTTFVVNALGDTDDGYCSVANCTLREAINAANANADSSTIIFNLGMSPQTIDLGTIGNSAEGASAFSINANLTIQGPGANLLTVRRASGGDYRIFRIPTGVTATIFGLTINNGNLPADAGGGILNRGSLTLQACALTGNHAQLGGGIVSSGTLNLTSSTVSGNSAEQGGGLYSQTNLTSLTSTIRNSTISGNTATDIGGGLYNFIGLAVIESSTITNNSGPAGRGSGVANSGFGSNILRTELRNNIVSANTSTDIDFIGSTNQFQSNGYNLIGNGNATGEFVESGDQAGVNDPKLGPLAHNGGPTFTHALHLQSPALNTGGSTTLTSDQRGLLRQFGSAVDKGSYELQPETYAFWSSYSFPFGAPANLIAPEADYDGDGLPNGLEQALGRNPLTPDAPHALIQFDLQNGYLVLQYERSITIDPSKLFAEASINLQTWSNLGISYVNFGPARPTTELIQALIPLDGARKKFGRLRYMP